MTQDLIIGVDLGGTNVRSAAVDAHGRVSHNAKLSVWGSPSRDEVIDRIARVIQQTMTGCGPERVRGIGIGTPGLVIADTGTVVFAPNLPDWVDLPLGPVLAERFHLPVAVENDANAAAIGEQWTGAGVGVQSLICLTLGTGVGGAIILDGRIWRGANGAAAEIGHMTVDEHGVPCPCGNHGCLEQYASAPAVARQAREALQAGRTSRLTELCDGNLDTITSALVAQAAMEGDEVARQVMHRAGTLLGMAMASLTNILNPEMFIIGGGMINAGELLFEPIWSEVRSRSYTWSASILRIVPATLGDDAGVIGAARNFMVEQGG
ncbi:MAG: ROK family protein [Candidatus Latescibacteria bacterium]|nr:ROK family protein [Candidatus Latescibacterota bacterium]